MASDGCDHNDLTHTPKTTSEIQPQTSHSENCISIIQELVNMLIGSNSKCKNSIETCRGQTTAASISLTSYQHRVPK